MNEKHWGQQGLLAVMLLALICSGPNSAVGSETAKSALFNSSHFNSSRIARHPRCDRHKGRFTRIGNAPAVSPLRTPEAQECTG